MTLYLPFGLPAARTLRAEGHDIAAVVSDPQDGRILRVALLNLMPDKLTTETQFARVLVESGRDVNLTLLRTSDHEPQHVDPGHMQAFYRTWSEVHDQPFDALIVTGAPVETLAFEDVDYWNELTRIFDWAERRRIQSLFVCWAAQAALYHRHGIEKHSLPRKAFGMFEQQVMAPASPFLAGLGPRFNVAVSRHAEVPSELPAGLGLGVLAASPETGLSMVEEPACRSLMLFDHLEYDADTLAREYRRDREAGVAIQPPARSFAIEDPTLGPGPVWRDAARRFFGNWLGQARRQQRVVGAAA
jgi:homoserine O-succinyltransferase